MTAGSFGPIVLNFQLQTKILSSGHSKTCPTKINICKFCNLLSNDFSSKNTNKKIARLWKIFSVTYAS